MSFEIIRKQEQPLKVNQPQPSQPRSQSRYSGCCGYFRNLYQLFIINMGQFVLSIKDCLPSSCFSRSSHRRRTTTVVPRPESTQPESTITKINQEKIRPHTKKSHSKKTRHHKKPADLQVTSSVSRPSPSINMREKMAALKALGTRYEKLTNAVESFYKAPTWTNFDKVKAFRAEALSEIDAYFSREKYDGNIRSIAPFERRLQEVSSAETIIRECVKACNEYYLSTPRS